MAKFICLIMLGIAGFGCCKKSGACVGKFLPVINVKITNPDPNGDNSVMLYAYKNNALKDSMRVETSFWLYPYDTYENSELSYVVKFNNKTETLSGFYGDFHDDYRHCSTCSGLGPKTNIRTYSTITYQNKGIIYTQHDTLRLSW